jgi:toxin ParE1/3/4
MIELKFHRLAAKEFREAIRWYAERSSTASARFELAVDDALLRIRRDPGALPIERPHFRSVRVKRFPFRLIFEHDEQRALILAVAHTSRRSGYWRRRK